MQYSSAKTKIVNCTKVQRTVLRTDETLVLHRTNIMQAEKLMIGKVQLIM